MSTKASSAKSQTPALLSARGNILQRKCACGQHTVGGGECTSCGKGGEKLRGSAITAPTPGGVPPIVHDVLRSPGRPLDGGIRPAAIAWPDLQMDRVTIHASPIASKATDAVGASAFAVGSHVVIPAANYPPRTSSDHELLAHELVHVAQSGTDEAIPSRLTVEPPGGALEREADRFARTASRPGSTLSRKLATDSGRIHRSEKDRPNKSRESKPKDAPRGTIPIDQTDLDKEEVHGIKEGVGRGPRDWVGISPDGHVITSDEDGFKIDNGPLGDYLPGTRADAFRRMIEATPSWLLAAIGVVGMILLIACFATGVCEVGLIVAGVSSAAASVLLLILKGLGIGTEDSQAVADSDGAGADPAEQATPEDADV